jgi:hypothetical protein
MKAAGIALMLLSAALLWMTIYAMVIHFGAIVEQGSPPSPEELARRVGAALCYAAAAVPVFITGLVLLIVGRRRARRASGPPPASPQPQP